MILTSKFYSKEAIEQAIEEYKEIADMKIINAKFEIELLPKKEVKHLESEFANYVLAVMQNS